MGSSDLHPDLDKTIGDIYDCVLDPTLWPSVLRDLCSIFDAMHGSITVHDTTIRRIRFATEWTNDPCWPHWRRLLDEKYAALMPFFRTLPKFDTTEVYNTEMLAKKGDLINVYDLPFFKEWALPSGRRDTIGSVVMKSPTRFGVFALHTSTHRDLVSQRELDLAARVVPHIWRSVAIGDLLSAQASQAEALSDALDKIGAAVFVTDARSQILHANAHGEKVLREGAPLSSRNGQLTSQSVETTTAIRQAISGSADPVRKLGAQGIGVPLRDANGDPAIAHVMPLMNKSIISGSEPRAVAAVFVTPSEAAPPAADALMALFGLTHTEVRVLLEIAKGKRRADAAASLGMADSTAKTHLDRVFSKTGTNDQSSLARLVASLAAPVNTAS